MPSSPLISKTDVTGAYDAAQRVVQVHQRLREWLRPGLTLPEIDIFVAKTLDELGARSCFLGYRVPRSPAFPSHACLSVNECVVHGTASSLQRPLKVGDILKVDIGVSYRGWIGDAAWSYVFGQPTPQIRALLDAGKVSLQKGIETLRPGNTLIAFARAVQGCVETERGFHLIRGLGGHGYGRRLHEPPFVSNTLPTYAGEWPDAHEKCLPGMLLAVEPMIGIGTGQIVQAKGQWPIYTADGSMSSHHEHDVLITEEGPRILTEGLDALDDVIPA